MSEEQHGVDRMQFTGPGAEPLRPFIPRVNVEHFDRYGNLPIHLDSPEGTMPWIRHDAEPHEDFEECRYPRTKVFKMWVPEDVAAYEEVMSKIGRGHAELRYEEPKYVEGQLSWIILLAWIEIQLELPKNAPITYGKNGQVGSAGKSIVHR